MHNGCVCVCVCVCARVMCVCVCACARTCVCECGVCVCSSVNSGHFVLKRENIKLLAPVTNPEKILCVGMNYRDHCEEQGAPVPEEPVIFSKFNSSIIGPTDDLVYPEATQVNTTNCSYPVPCRH